MNKPAYLGLSIQELSKILFYDFWYAFFILIILVSLYT